MKELFWMAIGAITLAVWQAYQPTPLQRVELAAYRECMTQAPRCRMTPQDFIRYYELKHQLETDDAKTNTE